MKLTMPVFLFLALFVAACDEDCPSCPGHSRPDTHKPRVIIDYPEDQSILTCGTNCLIQVSAYDDIAIDRVDFYINGILVAADYEIPYNHIWLTTMDPGRYTIIAAAVDWWGNEGQDTATIFLVDPVR